MDRKEERKVVEGLKLLADSLLENAHIGASIPAFNTVRKVIDIAKELPYFPQQHIGYLERRYKGIEDENTKRKILAQ